jgi:betaine-aldehyde dehydrogenase
MTGLLEQSIPSNVAALLGDADESSEISGICVAGKWIRGAGQPLSIKNPSNGQVIGTVSSADQSSVEAAVDAAGKARLGWSKSSAAERATRLHAIASAIYDHREELIALQLLNNGKPRAEAVLDVNDVITTFDYYAGLCLNGTGIVAQAVALPDSQFKATVSFEPCGVVALIVPWNFPTVTTAWKLAPALAAGCTVVLKPSELTPLAEIALVRLINESGLPPGVLNLVSGDGVTGAALVAHHAVAKISFTGSTAVGRSIMRAAAERIQRVSLELGGKSALIVLADADIDQAVELAMGGAFFNAGQMCSATSRILVHASLYDAFTSRFVARASTLRTGDPSDPETTLGPLISQAQRDRVSRYIESGKNTAKLVLEGKPSDNGYALSPTVFCDVPPDAAIWREEIFGPVACLRSFATDQEAIAVANDTEYGLVATIVSSNAALATAMSEQLLVGTVWINSPQLIFPQTGWGGFRQSGIGRELGPWGLQAYQEIKHVVSGT